MTFHLENRITCHIPSDNKCLFSGCIDIKYIICDYINVIEFTPRSKICTESAEVNHVLVRSLCCLSNKYVYTRELCLGRNNLYIIVTQVVKLNKQEGQDGSNRSPDQAR